MSLRPLRIELDRLAWIFLPAAFVMLISHHLDPLYLAGETGCAASMILYGSLAFALFRLLHLKRGVLAAYLRPVFHSGTAANGLPSEQPRASAPSAHIPVPADGRSQRDQARLVTLEQ